MSASLDIREIDAAGFDAAWPVIHEVLAGGDTWSLPPDLPMEQARTLFTTPPSRCFVATSADEVLGVYLLTRNQPGLGDHVANAGYMVALRARGRGIASAMCEHSLAEARRAGFTAMQFNFVVETNEVAVRLWQRHGFAIVGHVPGVFRHARLGPVGVYVMHRTL